MEGCQPKYDILKKWLFFKLPQYLFQKYDNQGINPFPSPNVISVFVQMICHLLGQAFKLQPLVSVKCPLHFLPPCAGLGFVHDRVLF